MSEASFRVCTFKDGIITVQADTVVFRNGGIRLLSNGSFKAHFNEYVYFTSPSGAVSVFDEHRIVPPSSVEPARFESFTPLPLFLAVPYALCFAMGVVVCALAKVLLA